MQKIYLEYPELTEIPANIVSRKMSTDSTQIILDRTIFMPGSSYLLKDTGSISDMEIISIDEKRDNIIHLVKGRPEKSEVILSLDMATRMRNLSYNTAYIIFKMIMSSFYIYQDIDLELTYDKARLVVNEFYDEFDAGLIEEQINFLIEKSLRISNWQGITSISPLGEVVNNEISFDNTSKVRGFKILSHEFKGNNLHIEIKAGSDILNL